MKSRFLPSIAALAIFLIAAAGVIFLIVGFFNSINAFGLFAYALVSLLQQIFNMLAAL